MRGILLSLALTGVVTLMDLAASPSLASMSGSSVVYATALTSEQQAQQPPIDVDIDINKRDSASSGEWYRSPLWLAIAILSGVVLLILLVLAFRGSGPTVIHRT